MRILTGKSDVKMQIAKVEMGIIRRHNTPPNHHPISPPPNYNPPPQKNTLTPSKPSPKPTPNQQRIRSSEVTLSDIIISVVYMSGHNSSLETEKN